MNLGLGNLNDLKQFIVTEAIRSQDDYDAALASIGKGVTMRFEKQCNRFFDRVAGAVDSFSADREHWYLSRFPAEALAKVETKSSDAEGWVIQSDAVHLSHLNKGLVRFGTTLSTYDTLVRITYTGGFWCETLEPTDEGFPTPQPEGSEAVPADLKLAWLMQCQSVFEGKDHTLPKGISPDGATIPFNLNDVKLLPEVEAVLRGYVRYQIV